MKSWSNWKQTGISKQVRNLHGASSTTEVCARLLVFMPRQVLTGKRNPEKLVLASELHLRWSKVACLLFNQLLYC